MPVSVSEAESWTGFLTEETGEHGRAGLGGLDSARILPAALGYRCSLSSV